ncbi:hypothetical protein niasHS_006997 [Heterodera schachtii]|uniref:NR LBD domain-containing protein n=1 Tax=Heterodera schachtii TaxID=97005 RepID=A0ABD2JFB8_HETSC
MKSCRACRRDKCLLEGMDPTMVEAEKSAELSQFIQSLYKRREFLKQQLKEKEEKICHMDTETVIENDKNGRTVDVRNEEIISVIQQLRTMPHFEMLEPIDQTILLRFVTIPLVLMNAHFHSSKDNSQIDTKINYKEISPVFHVAGVKTLQLSDEEFLLVRALISSHSAVFGLSDDGLRTLQHLSEHYANLLMHHLCTNYGNMAGAFRHAELVHMAKSMFSNAERLPEYYRRKFSNYFMNRI